MIRSTAVVGVILTLTVGTGCDRDELAPDPTPRETYLVVDTDAQPPGSDGFPGAVFRFDPTSNSVELFAADPRFEDPQRLIVARDGSLLLVDFQADPDGRGSPTGAVFRLDADTGAVIEHWSPPAFVSPTSLALGPGQTVYVTDRHALPREEGQGAVFALDLSTGACRTICDDPRLRAPADVVAGIDGALVILDADTPTAIAGEEGVLFRWLDGAVERLGELSGAVSPLSLLREPGGDWLVFDVNADPRGLGGPLGAVFRFRPGEGTTELVYSGRPFRDPVRGCLRPDGGVYLVDANADPLDRGPDPAGRGQNLTGRGAILSLDPKSGELSVVLAPEEFVNPVDITRIAP